MKPITLTMQAFGSYGKKTTIDFTKPEQNIFLITGDTGAGKTTIFDAIVYAIYGEASSSSNKKDGSELQGQFVDYDVEPYVELTFSEQIGGAEKQFTVRRTPKHIRKKVKGTGFTGANGSVSLVDEDNHEYSPKETNAKLIELVGLTKEQFMQIAMIAQGEFMETLRAKSAKKTEVFRKLFHTEVYRSLINELELRKKAKYKEIATIRTECRQELGHIDVPADYALATELLTQKKKLETEEGFTANDVEVLLEMVGNMCKVIETDIKDKGAECKKLSAARDAARDAYNEANNLLQQFKHLEQGEQMLAQCDAVKADVEAKGVLAKQISAAYEINGYFTYYQNAKAQLDKAKSDKTHCDKLAPQLKEAYEQAAKKEQETLALFQKANDECTRVEQNVATALDTFAKIKEAEAQVQQLLSAFRKSEAEVKIAGDALDAFSAEEAGWKEEIKRYEGIGERVVAHKSKCDEGMQISADLKEAQKLDTEIVKHKKDLAQAQSIYANAKAAFDSRNKELEHMRTMFYDSQAGILARDRLVAGAACPVCGSLEHPSPCVLSEEYTDITREMLEEKDREVAALNKDMADKAQASNQIGVLVDEKAKLLSENLKRIYVRLDKAFNAQAGEFGISITDDTLEGMLVAMAAIENAMRAKSKELKAAAAQYELLSKKLEGAEAQRERLKATLDKCKEDSHKLEVQGKGAETSLKTLKNSVSYESEQAAIAVRDAARNQKAQAQALYNPAKLALEQTKSSMESNQTLLEQIVRELPQMEQSLKASQAEYTNNMALHKITEEAWKDIVSRYQQEQAEIFRKEISAYDMKRTQATTTIQNAKDIIVGRTKPDLEVLKTSMEEANVTWTAADAELAKIRMAYNNNINTIRNIEPKIASQRVQIEECSRLDSLYRRMAGTASGSRMDIETYVQRYHLERILYAANRRFSDMTDGQYELRMYDIEKAGEGANHGLDLMVYSQVTGKEREIRTLSGGESFLAALALALGMADRVQEKSAGINLDVMFIDEGFGSLDDRSRGEAIKVLQHMAEGSKMIGIISHVTELKQSIEDKLIITKDDQGSHARWEN